MQKDLFIQVGLAVVAAFIISFAATPIVKSFAHRVGAIDVPKDGRRMHNHPIPRLGGLAIFLGFLLSVVLFADISREVQGILLGSVVVVIVGVIDDIVPLPALVKFVIQIGAALIAVYHGVVVDIITNPNIWSPVDFVNFGYFSVPITVLWIVAITNSVNLIDGLDGLAAGVSAISSFTMMIISIVVADLNVAIIMAALAGACIGFLPYNKNPAKIFMGDTGALLLGYVLATVSIIGLFKLYAIISFAVPFLVVGLPLFDTAFAFMRRILSGRNPMSPDRGHFHHRLIDMGFSQKQAVAIAYAISGILGLSAVVITTNGEIRAIILLVAIFVAGVIGVFVVKGIRNETENQKPAEAEAALPVEAAQPAEEAAHGETAPPEGAEESAEAEKPEDGDEL
ncbi:UDP-GlcNAc:undecaprenyl-phosphate GlcNAc-1-phosphate transferase [Sporobacter termitidis DSM 10068]|uniref:UDP-GlcNAc:undecaprenyl-phosphate GlcNAc-1-phosphate transferase n=1 Tax=Sporobacter termitidis DSM 10068 TaxID=1123282 RepID=A0A1M5WXG1_9FIRM|nr:MraY family glycosyltransferase [Sporobacter termitidis]SHH92289.1 UDP-GlcNAc:undecaprenyl-phosphate GlcNAc-1-phosphate transferase [Sporobacter termitidis DSM 10068]